MSVELFLQTKRGLRREILRLGPRPRLRSTLRKLPKDSSQKGLMRTDLNILHVGQVLLEELSTGDVDELKQTSAFLTHGGFCLCSLVFTDPFRCFQQIHQHQGEIPHVFCALQRKDVRVSNEHPHRTPHPHMSASLYLCTLHPLHPHAHAPSCPHAPAPLCPLHPLCPCSPHADMLPCPTHPHTTPCTPHATHTPTPPCPTHPTPLVPPCPIPHTPSCPHAPHTPMPRVPPHPHALDHVLPR